MSDNHLYVIELEDKKVFLHFSPPLFQDYLFQECIVLYEFVDKYRPIRILKVIDIEEVLEINYYVKYYMRHYGIGNVRGGNYTDEVLSPDVLKILETEVNTKISDYEKNIEIFENIVQDHQKESLNVESMKKLENTYEYFLKRKRLISKFHNKDIYKDVTDFQDFSSIIKDIEWMKDIVIDRKNLYEIYFNSIKEDPERYVPNNSLKVPNHVITDDKNRYKDILIKLNFLKCKYISTKVEYLSEYLDAYLTTKIENFKKYENDSLTFVYIRHPEYILDYFFLHPRYISNWESFTELANSLLDEFLYMAHSIQNLLDELNYDISKYSPDFEKVVKYTRKYYDLINSITMDEEELELINS